MMWNPDDPKFSDPASIAADTVEMLDDLCDDLFERAQAGDFSRHRVALDKATSLMERLYAEVPMDALNPHHRAAMDLLRRLQAACEVGACQGRA